MGFYLDLRDYLNGQVDSMISFNSREHVSSENYFNKRCKVMAKNLEETNWIEYWSKNSSLHAPNHEDKLELSQTCNGSKTLADYSLSNIIVCLCYSLKVLIDVDKEKSIQAKYLNKFFKMAKAENNKRPNMPHIPENIDEFQEHLQNKKQYINQEQLIEQARITGKFCPYCQSTHIISYGDKWKCITCEKYIRKH